MAARAPQNAFDRFQAARSGSSLESEIAQETAAALGRSGRALRKALEALNTPASGDERETLLLNAAEKAQGYFIQREMMGIRDHREIIREYAIPKAVLVRIGIYRSRS
ncbi:MAG: DUF6665 family protein [Henriciella sp.]|uniref:DUF6665 family protein n=1 Tax=Henriciella sp. TaxID=1968823 RepID=UPI003C75DABE